MPIHVDAPIRRLSQSEFGKLSFEVMREVFRIHAELGRFFEEEIYKQALAVRFPGVRLEVKVIVSHREFEKRYSLDVLVGDGGLFEFKATAAVSPRHRAQLTNYLLLCDLAHGKLVNVRPADVEHEFVNALTPREARREFTIDDARWSDGNPRAMWLRDVLVELLRDWGTGLELALYEEALVHFLGGAEAVVQQVDVHLDGQRLGRQPFRVVAPGMAFKLTAFEGALEPFEHHARKLLQHTSLSAILWANIAHHKLTLTTLKNIGGGQAKNLG